MTIAIEDARKRGPTGDTVPWVVIRSDDGLIEDLAAGEVGVQVDVGGHDKVLVVIGGRLAEGDQIGGRGDLVGVLGRPAAPGVSGLGGQDKQTRGQR